MPIVPSSYNPSIFFRNGHISTIYSGLFRHVKGVDQHRERLNLPDGDYLHLDWSYSSKKTDKLIVVLHGLEGNAQRPYMLGTAKYFNENGFDAVCVNFRGCSGEANFKYRSYHSGATDDLSEVINYITENKDYNSIVIKGFSLGGNMALKYLGERNDVPPEIKATVAVSVPCSLGGSCVELHKFRNILYHDRFKRQLLSKLKQKHSRFPERISLDEIRSIKTLKDFDDVYTSKAHGFKDANDYYDQCSSLQFLSNIKIPSLVLNAKNDSFLSADCYPLQTAETNPFLYLEMPEHGGHVGFIDTHNSYYNEHRALEFIMEMA